MMRYSAPSGALILAVLAAPVAVAAQLSPTPVTHLHQLPTNALLTQGAIALEYGETTTFGGQLAEGGGGTGNQTYQGLLEVGVLPRLMLTGFFDFNDDPTFGFVAGRRWTKKFSAFGGGLRGLVGEVGPVRVAIEGSLAVFGLISDVGLFTPNPGLNREWFTVGSLSAIASTDLAPGWRATFAPSFTYLPKERDGVAFYGWTTLLGFGVDGKLHNRWHVFATSDVPLGPGSNSLQGDFDFQQLPVWSAGTVYEASPKVQITGFLTNQSGATPSTRHLTLIGEVPTQYGVRARWTPMASERERLSLTGSEREAERSRSTALGGIQEPPALPLNAWTVDATFAVDNARSRSLSVRVGLSNELELDAGLIRTRDLRTRPTLGIDLDQGTHYRVGAKLALVSESWGSPVSISTRLTGGQDLVTRKGYFIAEALVSKRISDWARVTFAPIAAHNAGQTPVGVGLSAVLGRPGGGQLILEPTFLLSDQPSLWTAGLRLTPFGNFHPQLFVTTARSMLGIGRLLGDPEVVRVGAMVRVRFP